MRLQRERSARFLTCYSGLEDQRMFLMHVAEGRLVRPETDGNVPIAFPVTVK